MKRIGLVGHNDIRLFLRNKTGYIWLFVVPIAFIYFMGSAMRDRGGPSEPKPPVLIDNQDGGFLSLALLEELDAQGMQRVDENDREDAERGIRIPENFSEAILAKEPVELEFFAIEGSGDPAAAMIELRLFRALVALNSHLFETAVRVGADQEITEPALRRTRELEQPVTLSSRFAGRKPVPSGFNQALPGIMIMYLLLNLLIFGGASVAEERQRGVMQRFGVYPLSRLELALGKVYGRFLLGAVQAAFYIVLARFVFKLNVGANLAGIVLILLLFCWLSASLGVMVGSFFKSPDKTIPICIVASMVMAAMGGCWWPMEIVPDTMKAVGHVFPTAWAMDGLHKLINFGLPLSAIGMELLVLALFALGANLAAAKVLRY